MLKEMDVIVSHSLDQLIVQIGGFWIIWPEDKSR